MLFWGDRCLALAIVIALGSFGVDAGRGVEGVSTEDGGFSSMYRVSGREVSSSGSFSIAVIIEAISELDVGGLGVDCFAGVSKQRFRVRRIVIRVLHPQTS